MELKIKIKSSLPENFETAKNAPTGKLKIQEKMKLLRIIELFQANQGLIRKLD